jgi:dipeptidyl-peptidase-4
MTGTIVTNSELIPPGDTVPIYMRDFTFSKDESRILFATDEESIYRYSSKATYYLIDRATRKLIRVSVNGKQSLCTFSPDGNQVAFVRDNNLYISSISDLKEGFTEIKEVQITFDGLKNAIINGMTDCIRAGGLPFICTVA